MPGLNSLSVAECLSFFFSAIRISEYDSYTLRITQPALSNHGVTFLLTPCQHLNRTTAEICLPVNEDQQL